MLAAGTTKYTYNALNARTSITVGNTVTNLVTDPINHALTVEKDSRGNTLRSYDPGATGFVSGTTPYAYATDALGSIRAVMDGTGTTQTSTSYHPGETRTTTSTTKAPTNLLGFTGSYRDGSLYQMGAREYDPANGRFMSPDPAGVPGLGYLYASNNPLTATDPTGLSDWDWRRIVHDISDVVSIGSAVVGFVCTAAVVCAEVAPVAFSISGATGFVATLTSDQALSCYQGAGGCPQVVVQAALDVSFVGYGAIGKAATRIASAANSAADGVSLTLNYKDGWSAAQRAAADAKVAALNDADNLVVTQVQRTGTSAGSRYRSAGGVVPRGSDVDHVIDLQLGGADDILNMNPLDMSVNRSLGAQIANQIRGLETRYSYMQRVDLFEVRAIDV